MDLEYEYDLIDIRMVNIVDFCEIHQLNIEWLEYIEDVVLFEKDIKMNVEFFDIISGLFNDIMIKPPSFDIKKKIEKKRDFLVEMMNKTSKMRYLKELTVENVEYFINKNFRSSEYLYVLDEKLEMITDKDIMKYIYNKKKTGYVNKYIIDILREFDFQIFTIKINSDLIIEFDYTSYDYPIFIYK
jgi:hypothetical protein